jgi:hypothetical protein
MDRKTKKQSIRDMAIEVGEVYARQLEVWESTERQATALAEALYSSSGLEPHVPPEQWGWWNGAAAIADFGVEGAVLGRLVEACDEILSRILQTQQGGDALARGEIGAVRSILISAYNFKPGMSSMERLTEMAQGFGPRDTSKDVRRDYRCVDATAGASVWTPEGEAVDPHQNCGVGIRTDNNLYECDRPMGHDGRHSGAVPGGRGWSEENSRIAFRNEDQTRGSKMDIKIEPGNVDNLPGIGLLLRVTVGGIRVAMAEASDEFLKKSELEYGIDEDHVYRELESGLQSYMMRTVKRVTTLTHRDTHGNGMYRGRVLVQENSVLTAHFVHYDFSDGTTGPESVSEYVRESFRRTIHEATAKAIS